MASGSQNMTTDKARQAFYLDAPNEYGYSTDQYGNFIYKYVPDPDTPSTGYFHLDNNDKTISLRYYWDSGDLRIPGKVGIGYNPTTSGNTYKLYVNGTSYFNGNTTHNGIDYFGNGTTYYINNSGTANLNALTLAGNLTIGGNVYFTGLGEGLEFVSDNNYFGTNADARIIQMVDTNPGANTSSVDGGIIIRAVGRNGTTDTTRELLRIRGTNNDNNWHSGTFQWKGKDIVVETGTSSPTWSISIGGNAATATALTSNAGSGTQPIYFSGGKPTATSYALNATINAASVKNTFAYYSGTNAISSYPRIRNIGSARYPIDINLYNDAGNLVGEMWYDVGNATNVTKGQWFFLSESPNSTNNTGTTGKYEYFYLPDVDTGRTANASYAILTTKNKVTNAQLQYSSITLGATACSLGSTYTNITGPFQVLTSASESKAFSICRGSTSEATKIWVDDSYTHFYVENDETTANIEFRLHAADTESGGGANASTSYVYFLGSNNKSTIQANIFNQGYGSLYLNSKISTRPSGGAITQPGTDVNPVELVSFAASGADFGIVHISNDGCYVCNSADMGWAFAVFDTDKTVDFSNAANASFYVKQSQAGAVFKGTVTATSFDGNIDWGKVTNKPYESTWYSTTAKNLNDFMNTGLRLVQCGSGSSNAPSDLSNKNIATYNLGYADTVGIQFAVGESAGEGLYYRMKWSSWGSWHRLVGPDEGVCHTLSPTDSRVSFPGNGTHYWYSGPMLVCTITVQTTVVFSSWTTVATLPKAPLRTLYVPTFVLNTQSKLAEIQITTGGAIQIRTFSQASMVICANVCF